MSEYEDNTGFTGDGYESYPNFHFDEYRLHEVTTWSDQLLAEKIREHTQFLDRPNLLPHHIARSKRLLEHLMFELVQREDFDDLTLEHMEEVA